MSRRAKKRPTKTAKTPLASMPPIRRPTLQIQGRLPRITAWARRQRWMRFATLWLVAYAVLVSFFFRTVLRADAYLEIFPHELLFPLVLHACTALLITAVFYWLPWLRAFLAKLIAVLMMSLFIMAYDTNLRAAAGVIRAFTPGMTDAEDLPLVSVVYLVILVCISVLAAVGIYTLVQRSPRIKTKDAQLAVIILVGYLCILPTFSIARVLPGMIRESRVTPPTYEKPVALPANSDKPDIYYIVLDRYTNADTLDKQFGFDNTPFTGFLRDNNFTINDTASSNYPYTAMSVSSTMAANYTNKLVAPFKNDAVQSRTLYHNAIWQSPVVKALKDAGYQYHLVGSTYGASNNSPLAERNYMSNSTLTVFGREKRLRGIEALQFANSPYYQFAKALQATGGPLKLAETSEAADIRAQIATLGAIATEKQGGRFIFAHMLIPHEPFLFNDDGSLSVYISSDDMGKPIKKKYTDQITFINGQMQKLVTTIKKQSGDKAIIIFNADEGAYPQTLGNTPPLAAGTSTAEGAVGVDDEDMRTWSDDWLRMKFGILQAVHIPRATNDDLARLSSVNLFRIVLNRYAGYNLDYLPECHYGVINGGKNEYQYSDLTKRFITEPDKSCTTMQSLPTTKK